MSEKNLQVQEKKEVQTTAESTRDVPVYLPAVDIYESPNEMTLVVDMPGVSEKSVNLDLNNDELTISGSVVEEAVDETMLLREYTGGDYYRQFKISRIIDREKIQARITNGVLRVVLPKADAAKPRKIEIKTV